MKRALFAIPTAVVLLALTACGGGNSNPSTTSTTSGIKLRALVTDAFQNAIYILDVTTDTSRGNTVSPGAGPTKMLLMPDKLHTIILDRGSASLVVLDNATETLTASFVLPTTSDSIVASTDNKTVYAAVRNAPVTGQLPGAIEIVDITGTTGAPTGSIAVPRVRRLVLSHNGSKLLAFSDNSDQVAVIDTASKAVTYVSGFDRPVFGVFSSDDATAFILSCGAECGGSTARVNALTVSSNAVGPDVAVSGATVGLLDGGNLYVAGTNAGSGELDVISTSNMTVSKSGVAIADGYHSKMVLAQNGQLFIGATACGNIASGCLSIYNTASSSVVNSAAGSGDVTGIQPITGRSVVYVIEGGELVIWDTNPPAPLPADKQRDIVGQAYDVILID